MKRRLITSALPYVNNVPHLGNLIQVLSADAFARFCRLRGYDTLYVCGTDEYGTATETRAAEEGVSPRALCDRYHAIHADIYRWFNISFDKFGRTSTAIQTEIVQGLFKRLDEGGFIAERAIEQLHCPTCGRFLADRYVRGVCPHCGYADARGDQCENCGKLLDPTELKEPRCSTCGSTPALKATKHLYIDLPKIKDKLEEWIKTASAQGFWAGNAISMTQAWIRDGLHERAITRDLKWGIPVPKAGYEGKVFYVWFDAPIGYISITGNLGDDIAKFSTTGESEKIAKTTQTSAGAVRDWRAFVDSWWKDPDNVELFQFIGKDNIPFHTVIFPSTLLGSGEKWTMLHHMSSSEYLNYESGKFSKSKGIGVFGTDVMDTGIPADVWRFYIFYNRPEKSDSLFTWKDFQEKVNSELIGNLGNLVNRTLMFVTRYYGGKIPEAQAGAGGAEEANGAERVGGAEGAGAEEAKEAGGFWETVRRYEADIAGKLEKADLRDAFHAVFELSSFANKFFQDNEPWKKRAEAPEQAKSVIRDLAFVVRDLAVLVEPFMPFAAEKIASFFGLSLKKGGWNAIAGSPITASAPVTPSEQQPAPPAAAPETLPTANAAANVPLLDWSGIGKPEGADRVVKSEVLFTRLESDQIEALRVKYSGTQKERAANMQTDEKKAGTQKSPAPDKAGGKHDAASAGANSEKAAAGKPGPDAAQVAAAQPEPPKDGAAAAPQFGSAIDLRVAQIVKIEKHPKADKLYIETLEIAHEGEPSEERVIVSGLVPYYREEDLLGKRIIVAYNLKPAKLRGIESRGMLIAASCKDAEGRETVEVLDAGDTSTGTRVTLEGENPAQSAAPLPEIDIDTFFSVPLVVKDCAVMAEGKRLCLNGKPVKTARVENGEAH